MQSFLLSETLIVVSGESIGFGKSNVKSHQPTLYGSYSCIFCFMFLGWWWLDLLLHFPSLNDTRNRHFGGIRSGMQMTHGMCWYLTVAHDYLCSHNLSNLSYGCLSNVAGRWVREHEGLKCHSSTL